MPHHLHELPHTADIGFEVRAPTLEGLFEGAAEGLIDALGLEPAERDPADDAPADRMPSREDGRESEFVRLARPDLERLLVHWLRELLAASAIGGEVPAVEVREVRPGDGGAAGERNAGGRGNGGDERDEGDDASLRAVVRWRPATPAGPAREIKGVTYHHLLVARDDDGWHARVVLDV